MSVRFFNPGLTYQKLKPKLDEVYFRVMSAGDLILRKDVEEFEKRLAEFIGTKYAVALNSCTDALYLVLRGLGIRHRDEVIVPSRKKTTSTLSKTRHRHLGQHRKAKRRGHLELRDVSLSTPPKSSERLGMRVVCVPMTKNCISISKTQETTSKPTLEIGG